MCFRRTSEEFYGIECETVRDYKGRDPAFAEKTIAFSRKELRETSPTNVPVLSPFSLGGVLGQGEFHIIANMS